MKRAGIPAAPPTARGQRLARVVQRRAPTAPDRPCNPGRALVLSPISISTGVARVPHPRCKPLRVPVPINTSTSDAQALLKTLTSRARKTLIVDGPAQAA